MSEQGPVFLVAPGEFASCDTIEELARWVEPFLVEEDGVDTAIAADGTEYRLSVEAGWTVAHVVAPASAENRERLRVRLEEFLTACREPIDPGESFASLVDRAAELARLREPWISRMLNRRQRAKP
jgi:hypothetical protein